MIYRFDRYELDDELYELRADGVLLGLPRKSFDLLHYLLMHASRVVGKDELFEHIWSGEHVTESVLPVNIRTIRKALGEERSERILKTVRGRGYRVSCRVECVERGAVARGPRLRPGFVGRDALMAELRADYASATAGDGRTVLLFGDAGIGKTRAIDEFTQWCRSRSAIVLCARCPDDAGAPPFWPILQLLRAGMETLLSEPFRDALERSNLDLERAQSSLVEFFQEGFMRRMEPAAARFRLTQTLVRLVDETSRIAPLVLALDDLQCADEGTARICEAVGREIPGRAVLSLVAYRDSDVRRGSMLARVMGGVSALPGLRQVRLRGLDLEGVSAFVRSETQIEPPEGWVAALHERTEGNPFFLRETLRLLTDSDAMRDGPEQALARLGLPQGIREALGRRLDALSEQCNHVLRWSSVLGRRFAFPVLEHVCDMPSTELLQRLGEAEEAHIISSAVSGSGDSRLPLGEFVFVHGLIRETIYEDISGPERVLRHRRVAQAIERLYGGAASDRVFELARHFFEAAPGGDIHRAVDYCVRAARHASLRSAYEEAVRHYDRALRAEELRMPRDDLRYCCVLMGRADALWRAGRYESAQTAFTRAAELARDLGRYDLLGHCALGLVGWPRFNRLAFGSERPEFERARVRALVHEALDGLGQSNPSLRGRLTGVLVRTSTPGQPARRTELADAALELARESGDDRSLFHALLAKQASLSSPADVELGLELASEAVSLARQLRAPTRAFAAYEARIPLLFMLGDMEAADADIAAAEAIAKRIKSPACSYASARFALARALGDGHQARVAALLAGVIDFGKKAGDEGAFRASQAVQLWVLGIQGKAGVLREQLRETFDGSGQSASWSAHAAYFFMLADDAEGCRKHFDRLAEQDFGGLADDMSWLWHLCACADACAFLDDRARAERLYALIEPHRHRNVVNQLYCYRGSAAQPLARLAALLGDRDDALRLLEEALDFNRRIGARTALVWTQLLYASILDIGAPAERREAAALRKEVEKSAEELGIGGLIARFGDSVHRSSRTLLGGRQ